MQTTMRMWQTIAILVFVALALGATVAACGGGSTSSSASPAVTPSPSASSPISNEEQITANWEMFFAGTTSAARKIGLLQNGDQFADVIRAQADSALSQATQAKVAKVKLLSATKAAVTYSILMNDKVVLADQHGEAVLQDGVWKVGAASFKALLALEAGASAAPSPAATQ